MFRPEQANFEYDCKVYLWISLVTNSILVLSSMIAIVCLILLKKKFEYFVMSSLTLISISGILISYDSIYNLFFYMETNKYQEEIG